MGWNSAAGLFFCQKQLRFHSYPCPPWCKPSNKTLHGCIILKPRSGSTAKPWWRMNVKETLGITWASERFADYLIGLKFHIETDHKPLVPLLSTKNLDKLPARVKCSRKRMMRCSHSIIRYSTCTGEKPVYRWHTIPCAYRKTSGPAGI